MKLFAEDEDWKIVYEEFPEKHRPNNYFLKCKECDGLWKVTNEEPGNINMHTLSSCKRKGTTLTEGQILKTFELLNFSKLL